MYEVDKKMFEQLAALEHDRWSRWMKYMFANLTMENLVRWKRQMDTHYRNLSEAEKESDRKEVRRTLEILKTDVVRKWEPWMSEGEYCASCGGYTSEPCFHEGKPYCRGHLPGTKEEEERHKAYFEGREG